MSQQRRSRIPDEKWEEYKDTIKRLFYEEKKTLEGEDGVISTMARDHGFSAR